MSTAECIQSEFEFEAHFSRSVVARFDGATTSSDDGALLLRRTDRRLNLIPRLASCFRDRRNASYISHRVQELIAQRVYGLALRYEDLSDHDQLREDPLLASVERQAAYRRRTTGRQKHSEAAGVEQRASGSV